MSYTASAALGVLAAIVLDQSVLRVRLLCRRAFWTSYAIIFGFQLIVNGVLAGRHVVRYDPQAITGLRVGHQPVEDLMFGFALVLTTLDLWVWWGRRGLR